MEPDPTTLDQDALDPRVESATPPLRMREQVTASPDIFDQHRRLVRWVLASDGFFHPDVQIAFSPGKGFHAVVAEGRSMPGGTRIASCPMPITLSVLNALEVAPFSCFGTRFPDYFLRSQASQPESLQAFFLMEQLLLEDQSWWAPYIATLPKVEEVSHSQFEEAADLLWLEGTNLKAGFSAQTSKWKDMYLQGMDQLHQLHWANAVSGAYTWPRFRWAAAIFASRSFTSQVLDDTLPADKARLQHQQDSDGPYDLVQLFSQRFGVLLPLVDLLNHRPGTQVEWQARYSFVGLQMLEPSESGQELYNNYGPRDNEGLLLAYGFTIQNNPFDHVVISIRVPAGSPLADARTWKPDPRSDPQRRCFIFNHQHPQSTSARSLETSIFSFDLLDSVSLLCANERELQTMYAKKQTLMSDCLTETPKFEDGRLILATMSQLLTDCTERAARLTASDPATKDPDLTPSNPNQNNARIYRDSQLAIVQTAIAVCKYVLRSATTDDAGESIVAKLRQEMPNPIIQNLQSLIARHDVLTHPHELLTSTAILAMLPNALSTCLQKCLSEVESNLQRIRDWNKDTSIGLDKTRLAVILSALLGEYAHGVKLPHRISEWMQQLVDWYPPDNESWAYVPSPGPWAPGEEPPAELMSLLAARAAISPKMPAESNIRRWLRPERVCWGWNVMAEEMVRVPASVLDTQAETGLPSSSILIYWRCY